MKQSIKDQPRNQAFATAETMPRLDGDLLTERESQAQELPMSLAWYRRMRLTRSGPPFVRISNRIFYRRSALRNWIEKQRVSNVQ